VETSITKICTTCREEKAIAEFSFKIRAKGRRQPNCKTCRAKYIAVYYKANKGRLLYEKRYKTTQELIDFLCKEQCNSCAICCRQTELFVDHAHSTGRIRGLLCRDCNLALGLLKDNVECLEAAIAYLHR